MSPGKQRIIFTVKSPRITGRLYHNSQQKMGVSFSDDERKRERERVMSVFFPWVSQLLQLTSTF